MAYFLSRDYYLSYKFTRFSIYFLFLSDEGPMLETLDYTIRIGSTPIILYFDFYLYSAYAAHYVYLYRATLMSCGTAKHVSLDCNIYIYIYIYIYIICIHIHTHTHYSIMYGVVKVFKFVGKLNTSEFLTITQTTLQVPPIVLSQFSLV